VSFKKEPCPLRTRPDLLASFRAGDRAAALEVYRIFVVLLDRVLKRGFTVPSTGLRVPAIKKRSQREDVLQETFTRALLPATILAYDDRYDYLPFLCGIARNVITKEHRHHGRELPAGGRDSWAEDQLTDIEVHDEPEQTDEEHKALAIVRELVAELPEPMRAFFTARYVDRVSQRELAERLGTTEWKVKAIEKRLRKQLRARLERAGVNWGNSDG
jgi:RNA polymerase sigma factor (sigma-70 family)